MIEEWPEINGITPDVSRTNKSNNNSVDTVNSDATYTSGDKEVVLRPHGLDDPTGNETVFRWGVWIRHFGDESGELLNIFQTPDEAVEYLEDRLEKKKSSLFDKI